MWAYDLEQRTLSKAKRLEIIVRLLLSHEYPVRANPNLWWFAARDSQAGSEPLFSFLKNDSPGRNFAKKTIWATNPIISKGENSPLSVPVLRLVIPRFCVHGRCYSRSARKYSNYFETEKASAWVGSVKRARGRPFGSMVGGWNSLRDLG
jgi:hypothetical protein